MKELVMRAENGRLVPRDPWSHELVLGMKRDADVLVSAKQARNIKQTRFMYALLHKIADNHATLRTADAVMHEIKIQARLFDPIVGQNGKLFYVMRSLSFAAMDGVEFTNLFERQIKPIIRDHILPGVSDELLVQHVMETL